jgi:hypothetical protein
MARRIAVAVTALTIALGGIGYGLAQEGQDVEDAGAGGGACATPAAETDATPEGTPDGLFEAAAGATPGATPDASPAALLDECPTPDAGTPTG